MLMDMPSHIMIPAGEIVAILERGSDSLDRYLGEEIYANTDPAYLAAARSRLADTARLHQRRVGDRPTALLRAPGRLNAFLEYLDMCAGDHMSTTIDGDLPLCVSLRDDDIVSVTNAAPEFADGEFNIGREVALLRGAPWEGGIEDNWDNRTRLYPHYGHMRGDWLNFVSSPFLRVAWEMPGYVIPNECEESAFSVELRGVDMTFGESTIPLRGGTSSSSALVVLSFLALWLANSDRLPAWDIKFICRLLGEAEWYVGTHGGANDQTTILRNLPNCVLYNRHSQPEPDSTVLPSLRGVRTIVANSLWEANKTLGANHIFNLRKGWMDLGDDLMRLIIGVVTRHLGSGESTAPGWLAELISGRFGYDPGSIPTILERETKLWTEIDRHYNKFGSLDESLLPIPGEAIEELARLLPEEISVGDAGRLLGKDESAMERDYTLPYPEEGDYHPRSAAVFFINENRIGRALEKLFVEADSRLASGELTVSSPEYQDYQVTVGRYLDSLQATIRDDFQVSNCQLEALLDIAWAGPGYLGGKLTGAGCGGCVVVMVREGSEAAFCEYLDREYYLKAANFQVYRDRIAQFDPDVASGLAAKLDYALATASAQRMVVTFSRGAGMIDVRA